MQVNIRLRLLQADQIILEVENVVAPPSMLLPAQQGLVHYIPPPTTDVKIIELWYEREAGEYGVPRTTF